MVTSISNPSVLVDAGHGAWSGEVNAKGIFDLSFDFLVERQNLNLEKIQSSKTVIVHSTLRDATHHTETIIQLQIFVQTTHLSTCK